MLCAQQEVFKYFEDIRLAYGQSDEYSFVIKKSSILYGGSSVKPCPVAELYVQPSLEQLVLQEHGLAFLHGFTSVMMHA